MGQLHNIINDYGGRILIALIVVGLFLGRKAKANPELLVEGGRYNGPFPALEREPEAKEQLFKSWDEDTRNQLRRTLLWDFLFILIYPTSTALACFMAKRFLDTHPVLPFTVGLWILLLPPAAALFDVIENLILWRIINGPISNRWLTIARFSTASKFTLIGIASIYAAIGALAWVCLHWLSFLNRPLT